MASPVAGEIQAELASPFVEEQVLSVPPAPPLPVQSNSTSVETTNCNAISKSPAAATNISNSDIAVGTKTDGASIGQESFTPPPPPPPFEQFQEAFEKKNTYTDSSQGVTKPLHDPDAQTRKASANKTKSQVWNCVYLLSNQT